MDAADTDAGGTKTNDRKFNRIQCSRRIILRRAGVKVRGRLP
jgi:hypothetical protein